MANTRFSQLGLPLLRSWEDGLDDYFRRRRQARSLHNPEELSPSPDAERV
jgi:hypothetical protein